MSVRLTRSDSPGLLIDDAAELLEPCQGRLVCTDEVPGDQKKVVGDGAG